MSDLPGAMHNSLAHELALVMNERDMALSKIFYYEHGGTTAYELITGETRPLHRFTDEGICIRCGEDAEEWDAGCVEEMVAHEKERGDRRGKLLDLVLNEYYTGGISGELVRVIQAELERG